MRIIITLVALAIVAPAAAAPPGGVPTAPGSFSSGFVNERYVEPVDFGTPQLYSGASWRRNYLRRLDALCRSKATDDLAKCEEAWSAINLAYAQLQARKAARDD